MKAIDSPFSKLINGTTQFVIPVFQRDYRWTEQQCEQLWADLISAANDQIGHGHFIGSMVYVPTEDAQAGFTRWLLIDGQQRMTTLTLLLTALRDYIVRVGWEGSEDGPTSGRIDAYFLKNVQEVGSRLHKLILRRRDHATLAALLDRTEMPSDPSEHIVENYEFFLDKVAASDPGLVYRGISRLIVVDVTLDRGRDDPQLIFESLNSTGIDLSQSDLIRNFLLMKLPESEQTRLYDSYWNKIEVLYRGSEATFDAFIRDFIALETQANKQERASDLYFTFRNLFGRATYDALALEQLLSRLLDAARHHASFSVGVNPPQEVAANFSRLRRLTDVAGPLIIRLLDCYKLGTITSADFKKVLNVLESYLFRRAITGEQARNYWQVFAVLAHRLDQEHPLDSVLVSLARQVGTYHFPSDEEFYGYLTEGNIYSRRVCRDLLERLENYNTNEVTDVSHYSIEHILPQNESLKPEWRMMLGDNWAEVQRIWLHRLGNLTLTGYNSTYSDRPFSEKKSITGGFNVSAVRLNRYVREQEVWTANEMKERGEHLAKSALLIWPALDVDEALLRAADLADIKDRAARRAVTSVPMSARARELFEKLGPRIREISPDIIELAEDRSVSYHAPTFFLEVLPRKNLITLLMPLQFSEVDGPNGMVEDATQWKFFVNAVYEGGISLNISDEKQIDLAMPIIRQACSIGTVR